MKKERIEFHCHTNSSAFSGIGTAYDFIDRARSLGQKGIAITDSCSLQSYRSAYTCTKKLKNFKVVYGCELGVVDFDLDIVRIPKGQPLKNDDYCYIDVETTGVSAKYDKIISILFKSNTIEKTMLINPGFKLSKEVEQFTQIFNKDLKNEKTFEESVKEILSIVKGKILVMYNADFCLKFINSELQNCGYKKLSNTSIDTLDLSRYTTSMHYPRFLNVARHYGVECEDYCNKTVVLSEIFPKMIEDLTNMGLKSVNDLVGLRSDENSYFGKRQVKTTVLCKNKKGLNNLYRLVSKTYESASDYNCFYDRENIHSYDLVTSLGDLKKCRKNLLLGSGFVESEVIDAALVETDEVLSKIIAKYDYIEINPVDNYLSTLRKNRVSKEKIKQGLARIVKEAKKQDKLVIATCNARYPNKADKVEWKALLTYNRYEFNEPSDIEKCANQHLFSTDEMLKAFNWLGEKTAKEIVVTNTNKLFDMFEGFEPFDNYLRVPKFKNAFKNVKEAVYEKAYDLYGDKLDKVIKQRIEKELNIIKECDYSSIFYLASVVAKEAKKHNSDIGTRGCVASSFVAYLLGVSSCNPLPPHYVCPKCHKVEWISNVESGLDLDNKLCSDCGISMNKDGHGLHYSPLFGLEGEKVPDVDFNLSDEFADEVYEIISVALPDNNIYRAGVVHALGSEKSMEIISQYCDFVNKPMSAIKMQEYVDHLSETKSGEGIHPAGLIIVPKDEDINDFTPLEYFTDDTPSTHFEYYDIFDNFYKVDCLRHVYMNALEDARKLGVDVDNIDILDPNVMSLFTGFNALNIKNKKYNPLFNNGLYGSLEFGNASQMYLIDLLKPRKFSDLVKISSLSHGTGTWNYNAEDLIEEGISLDEVIGSRDDIMRTLLEHGIEEKEAYEIMERIRKGVGLEEENIKTINNHNLPEWFIDSCNKIRYLSPKAHSIEYAINELKLLWIKIYRPDVYYVIYYTHIAESFEIKTMTMSANKIEERIRELEDDYSENRELINTLETTYEIVSRGYKLKTINIEEFDYIEFNINPENSNEIICEGFKYTNEDELKPKGYYY